MITRTTTVGTMKTYRYNMQKSAFSMNKSMNQVLTRRYFNSFADDPAGAAKSFQLRSAFLRTSSQKDLNDSIIHKFDVAFGALDSVEKALDTDGGNSGLFEQLRALNDPDGSARNALGQSCKALARSVVQDMNGRYGDNFVFSGADGLNVPFTWEAKRNTGYDPEFDPNDPTLSENCQYLMEIPGANPGDPPQIVPTNDPTDPRVVTEPEENPNYDSYYEVDPEDIEYDESKALKYVVRDPATKDIIGYTNKAADENNQLTWAENPTYDPNLKPGDPGYDEDFTAKKYIVDDGVNPPLYTSDTKELPASTVPATNPEYIADNLKQYRYLKEDGTGTNTAADAAEALYYRGDPVDRDDTTRLDYYSKSEKKYVDIGLGYDTQGGRVESSTVFDAALQGTNYLGGHGLDKDGDPKNVVSILNRMGEILESCPSEGAEWPSDEIKEEYYRLCNKFEDASARVKQKFTELSTQATFLDNNKEQLTNVGNTLNEQIEALDYADDADSISEFIWAKYCYDTSLKVGNSVLGQSLMDYLDL
ncbi:MAG: hypothetical protein HDT19_05365 [Oscillibacter sp.]|nr:hypothetical protein [Oscillibacter sp.]